MNIPPPWRARAALALLLSAWAAGAAAEGGVTIPLPARPLAFELEHPAAPLEVASLSLSDGADGALSGPLRLEEGRAYDWEAAWRRTHAGRPGGAASLVLRLDLGGPVREFSCPVVWTETGAEPCSGRFVLPPGTGSGRSTLTLLLSVEEGGAARTWPLAVLPATVVPAAAPSTLDDARIREVFGPDAVRLGARFRLGPGAALEIPVPEGVPFSRVGLVSSIAWLPRQDRRRMAGAVFASLEAAGAAGAAPLSAFPIRLGVETLQTDGSAFDRERALEKRAVPRFDTWTVGGPDGPSPRGNYYAVFDLPQPHEVRILRLGRPEGDGVLLVDELVLLP